MIDPLETDQRNPKLLEIDIVVYHEGQPVNCRWCHH